MKKLVARKTYDKFTQETVVHIGCYPLCFEYYESPGYKRISVSAYNTGIALIDDEFRYRVDMSGRIGKSLTEEDLLHFCNAKTIDVSYSALSGTYSKRMRRFICQSLIPAAKLMYNTLYSPNYYNDDEIQQEWAETGGRYMRSERIKDIFSPAFIGISVIVLMILGIVLFFSLIVS